jgi:tetratricopeptide (TPR) repeat protein
MSLPALAQEGAQEAEETPSPAARAMAHIQAQEWGEAATVLEAALAEDPSQGALWMMLGQAQVRRGEAEAALEAYEKAAEAGASPLGVAYRKAGAYATLGRTDEAFAALDAALDRGFPAPDRLRADPDLQFLQEDKRFLAAIQRAEVNARPCAFDEVYEQFDFWLGKWDVYAPNGQQVGTNHIQRTEQGCAVLERWKSASGSTGRSVNFYDPALKVWRQIWTDSRGTVVDVSGKFENGAMRFSGKHRYPDGREVPYRMTFTPNADGTVRQLIEESPDGGEELGVAFDGLYKPAEGEPSPSQKMDEELEAGEESAESGES